MRKMPLTASAPPANASIGSASRGLVASPKPMIARPQTVAAEDDGQTVPSALSGPAANGGRDQGTQRRRRVKETEHAGAPDGIGDRRKERLGHAEDHRRN